MEKIGFLGLGNIGKGICKNLIEKGHELTVYDVNQDAMDRFRGRALLAKNEMEVFENSEYIFLSLPNSSIVEVIINQCLNTDITNKIIIDTSTSYPMSTKALYRKVKAAGGSMVDAPLMAGPAEADAGILDIVVGGDREDYDRLCKIFASYCRSYKYVGEIGNGHLAKLAMNFCGLCEALIFAQVFPVMAKLGISQEQLYDILNCNVLSNWVFDFYAKKYVSQEYHLDFALELGTKDLSYMKRLYEELNIPGFLLDGALDLCRVALSNQKPGEVQDFSYTCQIMSEFVKLDK